ncbi:MAG: hypothetical protein ABGZ53_06605, partial [Fuerstiella sp.]
IALSRETRMTHATRFVALTVLVALAVGVPVQRRRRRSMRCGCVLSRVTLRRIGKMYTIEARVVKLYSSFTCIEE